MFFFSLPMNYSNIKYQIYILIFPILLHKKSKLFTFTSANMTYAKGIKVIKICDLPQL